MFFFSLRRAPSSTLFPYTTLFRSLPINWLGAALILLAFGLFVLEVKVASHGILGAGGAVALVLGAVMLVDSPVRSEEHTSELQSHSDLVCRLLLEKKNALFHLLVA